MPLSDVLILVGIVSAFLIFGIALAWGQYQTQGRELHQSDEQVPRPDPDVKKAA